MTRHGTELAVKANWELVSDGGATHISSAVWGDTRGVIRKLQEVDRFEAFVVTAARETLTADWDVRGLQEALDPIVAVCGEPPR